MVIAFVGAGAPASSASTSSLSIPRYVGTQLNNLLLLVIGVENVGSASAPWTIPNTGQFSTDVIGPFTGWERVLAQEPSATGNGLEVWAAINESGFTPVTANFNASYPVVAQMFEYSGEYRVGSDITQGTIRASTTAQVTGDNPAAPSVFAFTNEMLFVAGSDQLNSPGYGTPTPAGWTKRGDAARGGTFGNVEITGADATVLADGNSGLIPWSAVSASGGIGATATLAVRPVASPPVATAPAVGVVIFPRP